MIDHKTLLIAGAIILVAMSLVLTALAIVAYKTKVKN